MGEITRGPRRERERFERSSEDKCGSACDVLILCVFCMSLFFAEGFFVFFDYRVERS